MAALEDGSSAPGAVLKAIAEKEKTIGLLEAELRQATVAKSSRELGDVSAFVTRQLADLAGLLKADVPRVKSEFRRLNLALTFHPTEAKPRPYYVVKGQCDLSALGFSRFVPADSHLSLVPYGAKRVRGVSGASLDLMGEGSAAGTPDRYAPVLMLVNPDVVHAPGRVSCALFLCLQPGHACSRVAPIESRSRSTLFRSV